MYKLVAMKIVRFIIVAIVLSCSFSAVSCNKEEPEDDIVVSNIFTPNEDGHNSFFEVRSVSGEEVELNIYTRAGVLVFRIKAELCIWDGYSLSGQPLANGIYFYTAQTTKVSIDGFVYLFR